MWAVPRNVWITAAHIPGVYNVEADEESRIFREDREWALSHDIFDRICQQFGPLEVDIFATRVNTKLRRFHSWLPDPDAECIDTFTTDWGPLNIYAFPPFCLIGRVLQKIVADKVTGVIVVPDWPTKSWYAMLNKMTVAQPMLIPVNNDTLYLPCSVNHPNRKHPLSGTLNLKACMVCGRDFY